MVTNQKDSTKKGEYIDLKGSDFKKKSNLLRNSILILILTFTATMIGFFLRESGILNNKFSDLSNQIFVLNEDNKNILSSKLEENIFELEEKLESLKKNNMEQIYQIEKILEENIKLRDKLKSVEALAKKNNKPFNEVENEIYFVFQIFKYKFLNDKDFSKEINKLFLNFSDNEEMLLTLNFFQNSINRKSVTKESIYEKLNLKIRSYDEDIEFFAKKLESKNRVDQEKIFESKENFINYIKDIFASTIKVTKLKEEKKDQDFSTINLIPRSLEESKEYLITGNLKKFISKIEEIGLDDEDVDSILEDSKFLNEIEENLKRLETIILIEIGSNFD